jgi:FkbM family methyltransferase
MDFTSQFEQDKHVIAKYAGKRDGYFVEVGAYDGVESSNTYVLEKNYNWKGICVECNPRFAQHIPHVRNCHVSTNAIYNVNDQTMEFYDSQGYSGLVKNNQHPHIVNDPVIQVTTKTLTTLLDEFEAPSFIEYLSLDTEGSEYDILKAHDFEKYRFGYICVEHNHVEKNRVAIRELLEQKGYRFARENGDAHYGIIDDEYEWIGLDS